MVVDKDFKNNMITVENNNVTQLSILELDFLLAWEHDILKSLITVPCRTTIASTLPLNKKSQFEALFIIVVIMPEKFDFVLVLEHDVRVFHT